MYPDQALLERVRITIGLPTDRTVAYYPSKAVVALRHVARLERLDRAEPAPNLN